MPYDYPRGEFAVRGNTTLTLPRAYRVDLSGYRYEKVPSFDVTMGRWIDYFLATERGRRAWEELANERV